MNEEQKKQIKAIIGDIDIDQQPLFDRPLSHYHVPNKVTQKRFRVVFDFQNPTYCRSVGTLNVYASNRTDETGKTTVSIQDQLCGKLHLVAPIYFVATPKGKEPVSVTFESRVDGDDVKCDVFSWLPDGSPAPNIRFNWHCSVGEIPIIE